MRASLSSRSSAEASRSAIDCSHWASSAEKTPSVGGVDADDPEGAGAPADRGRGGAADAAVAQPGGVEAPLARPLPDGDGLLAGERPSR